MKYFCKDGERVGSCYHEFLREAFTGANFRCPDSLFIHDDTLTEIGLAALLFEIIPGYDQCGVTVVTCADWRKVRERATAAGGALAEAAAEADAWAAETFARREAFTILGI